MHLVINAVGVKHSGGAVVLLDFLQEALAHEAIEKVSIFCSPRGSRNFDFPVSEKCIVIEEALAERSYLYRIVWSQFVLPRLIRTMSADAFICLVGIGLGGNSPRRTLFIQQSLPFVIDTLPALNARHKLRLRVMRFLMRRASRDAQKIIVQTSTMQKWVSFAFRLPQGKFVIIKPTPSLPIITDDYESVVQMERAPIGLRLLNVGSDSLHKNLSVIVEGMAQLRLLLPGATLFLTLPLTHPYNQVSGVECIGYLHRGQLWKAYELSAALVIPSFVETVGLPMLEALSVDRPVLAADRPYAHDICGESALFFDPLSVEDFVSQAHTLLSDLTLQERLVSQGKRMIAELSQEKPYNKMVGMVISPNK